MNRPSRIRELNDAFRRTFSGGRVVVTRGIAALPAAEQATILHRVQNGLRSGVRTWNLQD